LAIVLLPSRFLSGTKKPAERGCAGGLGIQLLVAQDGELHAPPPVAAKLIVEKE